MEYSWETEQQPAALERLIRPPPLTHEDNRRFLQMLREKKERYNIYATDRAQAGSKINSFGS
jgi:hypothetical protein